MVSIHGPLGYEPNTLTSAPLCCWRSLAQLCLMALTVPCMCSELFHIAGDHQRESRTASGTDSLAEWSKALAPGASPQGRGFEPHSCHLRTTNVTLLLLPDYRSLVWCHKQFALVFINTYSGTCVPRWCSHIILFGVEHRLQLKLAPAPFWHARTA